MKGGMLKLLRRNMYGHIASANIVFNLFVSSQAIRMSFVVLQLVLLIGKLLKINTILLASEKNVHLQFYATWRYAA